MKNKNVLILLNIFLAFSCILLIATLLIMKNKNEKYPEDAKKQLIDILSQKNITIDADTNISQTSAKIFLIKSEGYNQNVAKAICNSSVQNSYVIPDGEIIVMDNGSMFEFKDHFVFSYRTSNDEIDHELIDFKNDISQTIDKKTYDKIQNITFKFLDIGIQDIKNNNINISSEIQSIISYKNGYCIKCCRTIDSNQVTDNEILLLYVEGQIVYAEGKWCFLTDNTAFDAELVDIYNILFTFSKDVEGDIRITDISLCYSLNYYGEGDSFCLAPYWKLTDNNDNVYIYSAIDGAIYTK